MKLEKVTNKVRCDFGLCRKDAAFVATDDGVMPRRRIYLCADCVNDIYKLIGGEIVPKSPINVISRAEKRRGETL